MEGLAKSVLITAIILLLIFVFEIVALPVFITVMLPLMPIAKASEFASFIAQGVSKASLFLERHFNLGTGNNAYGIENEAYAYNWMMGQFAKVISFSQRIVSRFLKKYVPMRRTDVPMGAPIPMKSYVYQFMDTKYKTDAPYYDEIERYVTENGKEIPPNNKGIVADGGDIINGINPAVSRGRNPKEWLDITGKNRNNPIEVMDGILYDSNECIKFIISDDSKEEEAWSKNKDDFLKEMTKKWNEADEKFQKWLSTQYTVIDGKKYPYVLAYNNKKVSSEIDLNACWVYSPIEGWCLKKEGKNKDKVYPMIGTRENKIYFPELGYHIYEAGKMINWDTYEHRYVGVVLTGLRTIGAESLKELVKKEGKDKVISMYYGFSQSEVEQFSDSKKNNLIKGITHTTNTRDSYTLLIQGKPFPKRMLEYWLKRVIDRTGDRRILGMLDYVDEDGFYVKLREKGSKGVSPLSKGRVYTIKDGNLFAHYDPFHPVPKNFNVFDRNTPTPLFLAETSHKSGIHMDYYYDAGYYYAYKDENTGEIKWKLVKCHPILLGSRSRVWGPNPTGIAQMQDCKFLIHICPVCYQQCLEKNKEAEKAQKTELAHENHIKSIFPIFYKIEDLGQGIKSDIVDNTQNEADYKEQIYYRLLQNGYESDKSGLFSGVPLDPSMFMQGEDSFLNYTEGGAGKVPTKAYYPKQITSATPYGNPVNGCISSPFGWRDEPIHEFHLGVDIAVPAGTEVHSTSSGTVYYAGWSNGYGFVVEVESHDENYWYLVKYAHLSQCLVSTGDAVRRGEVIGLSGSTGFSTGPHLHYEIHVAKDEASLHSSDTAQDPLHWGVNLPKCGG